MICTICNNNYKEIIDNKCVFCNIIHKNNKYDVFNIVIGITNLSQIDIINKTYEFFMKNNRIPYPNEIDDKVKILNVNPYIYRKDNSKFNNCQLNNNCLFFTNCIDYNKIKTPRFPLKFNPQQQLNLKYNLS